MTVKENSPHEFIINQERIMMKKLLPVFIVCAILILPLGSCAEKTSDVAPSAVIAALAEKIPLSATSYASDGNKLSDSDAARLYSGDANAPDMSLIESYALRECTMSDATEAGVFRVYSASDAGYVRDMCRERIQKQQKYFAQYADQGPVANNAAVRAYGKYVYYVMAADMDGAFKVIEGMIQGKS